MDISIIIVNYKTAELTLQCIDSILQYAKNIDFEIIVIDNASNDNSSKLITEKFNTINFIELKENIGYGRANNIGIKQAKGKYILILNNDTIFIENILEPLCTTLETHPSISAACVQLYYLDGEKQLSGSNFVFWGLNTLLTFPITHSVIKSIASFFKIKKPHPQQTYGIEETDWISGAFMFIRKETIEKAGIFDEDFFLFSEEAEWCFRLKKYGKIVILPELSIVHIGGQTMQKTMNTDAQNYYPYWENKGLQLMVSNLLRIRKQYGILAFFTHILIYFIHIPIILLYSIYLFMFNKYQKPTIKQALEYIKNCLILFSFIMPILLKKNKLYKAY